MAKPDPAYETVRRLIGEVSAVVGREERVAIRELWDRRNTAPTVALVGRVSAGKSTLVNALVGSEVAATDAGECTQVATLYEYGAPERFEVFGFDGAPRQISGLRPAELGKQADEVDYTRAYTPQARLRDRYRVLDTPGLSSLNSTASEATARVLISSTALPRPDVVLFLVEGGHLRTDEIEFLQAMGASSINTILVVSRADAAGEGVLGERDPFTVAQDAAGRLAREHADLASRALAVAGLMAESAEVGISEEEASLLAGYAGAEDFELVAELQTGSDPALATLNDRIGLYGVIHGREHARRGAIELSRWLDDRSGLASLHRAIEQQFRQHGPLLKVQNLLSGLRRIGETSAVRAQVLSMIEQAEQDPALHRLREVAVRAELVTNAPGSDLIGELERVTNAPGPAAVLGTPDPGRRRQAAIAKIASCRRRALTTFSSAELSALHVLERSYRLAAGSDLSR